MKYISIDIETTGLNAKTCQILEFGAVATHTNDSRELNELPVFHRYLLHSEIVGEPYALELNAAIVKRIETKAPGYQYCKPSELLPQFVLWLRAIGYGKVFNAAGKNFSSFDLPFIKALDDELTPIFCPRHRVIDPSLMYWLPGDETLPNLSVCKTRAGLNSVVSHQALDDAKDVIALIRHKIG